MNSLEWKNIEFNNSNFLYLEDLFNKELLNGYIQKIQLLNTNEKILKIKIRKENNKELLLGLGFAIISNLKTEAKPQNKGFAQQLNNILENKKIMNIKQINLEKILLFEFLDYNLYCEFFSNNNIILTDKNNKIILYLLKEEWKERKISKNEIYVLPKNNFKNILEYNSKKEDINLDKNLVSNITLNTSLNPKLVEKYLEYKNINKDNYTYENFQDVINYFKEKYINKKFRLTYFENNNKINIFNLDFEFLNKIDCEYNNFIEKYILKNILFADQNENLKVKNKEKNNIENILKKQKMAKEKIIKEMEIIKEKGDFIYSNYDALENIQKKLLKNLEIDKEFIINNKKLILKKIDKRKQKFVFSFT